MSNGQLFRFGDFELDTHAEQLTRGGREIRLAPQPMRVLLLLVKRHGALVTRDELHAEAWDGRHVAFDYALNFAIVRLRRALGDAGPPWTFIDTVPRRGYRFVAPVSLSERHAPDAVPTVRRPSGRAIWAALTLTAAAGLGIPGWNADVAVRVLPPTVAAGDRLLGRQLERDLLAGLGRQDGLVTSTAGLAAFAIDTSIDRADERLVVTAILRASGDDRPRWQATVIARPDELPQVGRDLAADVRRAVQEPADRRTVTIERE